MSSTSKTMLETRWSLNRSWAASRVNPLNPHCVSWTGPTAQIEASEWNVLPSARRKSGWLARMSDRRAGSGCPAPRRGRRSARTSSGIWSGGVAMSASAKTRRSASAASIPALTAEPLPPCGTVRSSRESPSPPRSASASGRARTRAAVPSALPSSTTSTSISPGSCAAPGAPSRPSSPAGAGTRTARPAPAPGAPLRCRRAGRWSDSGHVHRRTSGAVYPAGFATSKTTIRRCLAAPKVMLRAGLAGHASETGCSARFYPRPTAQGIGGDPRGGATP